MMRKVWRKYKRLRSSYRCHRYRGKTHLQILLESLARVLVNPSVSIPLLRSALKRHDIRSNLKLTEVLSHGHPEVQGVKRGEILRGRFFVELEDEELWTSYMSHFGGKVQTVIQDAETISRHEFNFLGSGDAYLGNPIDWHIDPVSGYRWPNKFYFELKHAANHLAGNDIKWPWELSRMQHLPTLGKAYHLTKNERYATEIVSQITQWWKANPCSYGVNWTCAMDIAIRIMNIIWAYRFTERSAVVTDDFRALLAISIFHHAQFVLFNLEYGIRDNGIITNGNHYLTNIVGLLHLGLLCPEFTKAETWRSIGLKALIEEMDRQILPDGVDFESSISYHRLVLELFLASALLCRVNDVALPDRFWEKLERMFDFVLCITRPDGKAPQVGDADDGRLYILSDYRDFDRTDFRYLLSIGAVVFHRSDMKAYSDGFSEEAFWLLGPSGMRAFAALDSDRKERKSKAFRNAGIYVMRENNNYLLACCGDSVEGHKHNDLLSFELFAGDKSVIVDPGSYVYTRHLEWRNLFRSTKYHNTVVIDGQEQNRFNPNRPFQMSGDAGIIVHEWLSTPDFDWLDVEHTGYLRLKYPVRHRRTFRFEKSAEKLEITDVLLGSGTHTADWYFHFDYGIEIESVNDGMFRTCCNGLEIIIVLQQEKISLISSIEDGWVSKRYGHKTPAKILHMRGVFDSECHIVFTVYMISN